MFQRFSLLLLVAALAAAAMTLVLPVAGAALVGAGAALVGAGAAPAVATAGTPSGPGGYWLVASDGGIFSFGGVPFEGSTGAMHLNRPIVGMAAMPTGQGYWLVASDGGVFAFGDAAYRGSLPGLPVPPASSVVTIAPTPDGQGYWIVTAAGGVYAFGDAGFFGSIAGLPLIAPVVAFTPSADGAGYWLTTSTGGVYTFGDAQFHGSAALLPLKRPIVGMTVTPDGGGYWLVASDGGIFSFGDALFHGSTGGMTLNQPVVGMAASPDGAGYWLLASDGGIFSFGDAPFRGSTGGRRLNAPIVGMAVGHTLDPWAPGTQGNDISWPQCGGALPPPVPLAIVGVNGGRPFTPNPCFAAEAAWAGPAVSVYMNLSAPESGSTQGLTGPAGQCTGNDTGCMAYNYGFNAAQYAYGLASSAGVSAGIWWLDVETANAWDSNTFNNSRTIQGALDALGADGVVAGIYSTSYQWGIIAGGFTPKTPIWVATGADLATAVAYCDPSHGFGGGVIWLTQFGAAGVPYDQDYACPVSG